MASIWDMLFPGASQAPQFADPNGNPNAQLPVPFPGPQQAPWLPQTTPWPQDAAPLTAQQRYRAAQAGDESRMPTFQRTGPTLPGMIAQSMEDTGRMMTTAPPAMPQGAYMDAGGPAQGTADPQAFSDWLGEMRQRGDLAPSMALGMIGGGTAFAPRSALGAAGAKIVQPAAEATAETVQPGIRAYHGSPHDFTQFDLSKIGTGEGAQAYGHGLYFAENEGTAKTYRDTLAQWTVDGKTPDPMNPNHIAAVTLKAAENDPATAIQDLRRTILFGPAEERATAAKAIDLLQSGQRLPKASGGHMYEVNIGAHPEQFLDWDKPISQQNVPPHLHERASDALEQRGISTDPRAVTGADLYHGLSAQTDRFGAAEQLRQAGIPGIRYLDQGSRTAGEGSRNYVVFDPKMIEIMRKYGIAGMLGGGAAASQLPIPPQKAPVF